jgi:hypothetical protein
MINPTQFPYKAKRPKTDHTHQRYPKRRRSLPSPPILHPFYIYIFYKIRTAWKHKDPPFIILGIQKKKKKKKQKLPLSLSLSLARSLACLARCVADFETLDPNSRNGHGYCCGIGDSAVSFFFGCCFCFVVVGGGVFVAVLSELLSRPQTVRLLRLSLASSRS